MKDYLSERLGKFDKASTEIYSVDSLGQSLKTDKGPSRKWLAGIMLTAAVATAVITPMDASAAVDFQQGVRSDVSWVDLSTLNKIDAKIEKSHQHFIVTPAGGSFKGESLLINEHLSRSDINKIEKIAFKGDVDIHLVNDDLSKQAADTMGSLAKGAAKGFGAIWGATSKLTGDAVKSTSESSFFKDLSKSFGSGSDAGKKSAEEWSKDSHSSNEKQSWSFSVSDIKTKLSSDSLMRS